ncbi:hypothetical protein HAX54_002270, partial [Datura stramonium]|nr:hypothetical protein [Datura stramonium]
EMVILDRITRSILRFEDDQECKCEVIEFGVRGWNAQVKMKEKRRNIGRRRVRHATLSFMPARLPTLNQEKPWPAKYPYTTHQALHQGVSCG